MANQKNKQSVMRITNKKNTSMGHSKQENDDLRRFEKQEGKHTHSHVALEKCHL